MHISKEFPRITVPGTGRKAIQLTSGHIFCYPLYYFIPSITADNRYLVYYQETAGPTVHEIQLYRLNLESAETLQLTHGKCQEAEWQPWGADPASGILGDRAALSSTQNLLVYIEGQQVYAVNVASMYRQLLFEIPKDRYPLSQNCISGNGEWFVYVHVDRKKYRQLLVDREHDDSLFRKNAHMCEGTEVCAYHFDSGEHRVLLKINYPIHHVHPYGRHHLVFSHVPGHMTGMGLTDIEGGWYTVLRTPDAKDGRVVHHVPTTRGIAYELTTGNRAGVCNPLTHAVYEFQVPPGTSHTGLDPEGLLFFYQICDNIEVLLEHSPQGNDRWLRLLGPWPTYGRGQKTHFHPRLTSDRQWMQLVAGDPRTETNHIFLLDVSDLDVSRGIPDV